MWIYLLFSIMCFNLIKIIFRPKVEETKKIKKEEKKIKARKFSIEWKEEKVNTGIFGRTNSESKIYYKKFFNERRNSI